MRVTKRPTRDAFISLYTRDGLTDTQIARQLKVNRSTVYRWKKKYGIETDTKQLFLVRLKRGGEG